MAERVVLVCDVCGEPATETVSIKAGGRSLHKDLCQVHLAELTAGARAPKRGRRAGATAAPSSTGRGGRRTGKASTSKAGSNWRRRRRTLQAPAEG